MGGIQVDGLLEGLHRLFLATYQMKRHPVGVGYPPGMFGTQPHGLFKQGNRFLFPAEIFQPRGQPGNGREVVGRQFGRLAPQFNGPAALTGKSIQVAEGLVSLGFFRVHLDGPLGQCDTGLDGCFPGHAPALLGLIPIHRGKPCQRSRPVRVRPMRGFV